jgi:hypothetical protein
METQRLLQMRLLCKPMLFALYDADALHTIRHQFNKPWMGTLRWGSRPRHPLGEDDQGPKPLCNSALFDAVNSSMGCSCQAHRLSAFAGLSPYGPMRSHVDIRCDCQTHGSPGYPTAAASTSWAPLFPLFVAPFMLQAPGGHAPWKRDWRLSIRDRCSYAVHQLIAASISEVGEKSSKSLRVSTTSSHVTIVPC